MFDRIINSGALGDYEYLFKRFKEPKKVYRRDIAKSNRIVKDVMLYNKSFSDTFFTAWLSNIFLRYAFLVSNNKEQEITRFEKIHNNKQNKIEKNALFLYKYFKFIKVDFIDYLEFHHNPSYDVLALKLCVTGKGIVGEQHFEGQIDEQRIYYYDIEFVKENNPTIKEKTTNYTSNCPNCGAPTVINTFGICSHCKEIVSIYDNIWKIRRIHFDN